MLTGKIALVTGGAQGIGRAIAARMEAAGAKVMVGDLRDPGDIAWHALDVTDETSIRAFCAHAVHTHGRIDILVNNAGIMFEKSLEEQTAEDWDRMSAINLRGPFLMAKHGVPHMPEGGAIVNIGSLEGHCCNPGHTAYAATKAGVHGLTLALAVDLGPRGIRANTIAPGWIDTDLNRVYVESHPDRAQVEDALAKLHPIGHIGQPEDVGDVAVYLASDAARFVTGQRITVDGGRTARPPLPAIFGR
ncbi:MAG: SDR family oxidoreductase [Pseudomonadota bacterium]